MNPVGQESLNLLIRIFIELKVFASLVTYKWSEVFIPNPAENKRTLQTRRPSALLNGTKLTENTRRHKTEGYDLYIDCR